MGGFPKRTAIAGLVLLGLMGAGSLLVALQAAGELHAAHQEITRQRLRELSRWDRDALADRMEALVRSRARGIAELLSLRLQGASGAEEMRRILDSLSRSLLLPEPGDGPRVPHHIAVWDGPDILAERVIPRAERSLYRWHKAMPAWRDTLHPRPPSGSVAWTHRTPDTRQFPGMEVFSVARRVEGAERMVCVSVNERALKEALAHRLEARLHRIVEQGGERADGIRNRAFGTVQGGIGGLLILLGAGMTGLLVWRKRADDRRRAAWAEALTRLGAGDFPVELEESGDAESRHFARRFNLTAARLQRMLKRPGAE